ncbi:hypothetical protein OBBRIDRAFT_207305 [Obba rivulosa]|uniref:Uncharacterized protein n=1 Tax=Obba rivulosa TaxID=1052685 RepID=A0A8E2DH59_9APHY|nr:hypothetical protein OBBRIDRAFT_207305 [Obba rivulosa]
MRHAVHHGRNQGVGGRYGSRSSPTTSHASAADCACQGRELVSRGIRNPSCHRSRGGRQPRRGDAHKSAAPASAYKFAFGGHPPHRPTLLGLCRPPLPSPPPPSSPFAQPSRRTLQSTPVSAH